MKKIQFILLLVFSIFYSANAQQYVKTEKVFTAKTGFDFTNEWQYVSTDIYLFNSSKFNNLLNRINPGKKRRKKNKDVIKNILVTAQLQGLGDLDALTYPIFNFIVSEDDDGNLQAQVTEPEVIRIVDNFPVSSINGYMGAKINVQIYSDKNRPELYKFIASQLESAASLTAISASDAALKAVGEIGKFMQQDAAGKQYQFESTIRFYQDQDFDRRLHSITIFVFQPSTAFSNGFDTVKIAEYFTENSITNIDKDKLNQLINYNMYPYIIAVNYRSKYKPQISDNISFDMLRGRETTNESNYKNEIISLDIYLQEKSLIDFLKIYAKLQFDINNYELDYNAKITEDFTIELFIVLQDYWKLKNTYKTTSVAFAGNPLFENEFKPLYSRYLTQADLGFEGNSSLRAIREHVETIFLLENNDVTLLDSAKREDYLRKLKSIDIPAREVNSDEAIVTKRWISTLENQQFTQIYKPKIDYLSAQPVITPTYNDVQKLRLQSATSYCDLCKINVQNFEDNFMIKYNDYLFEEAKKEYNFLINQTRTKILEFSKKQYCIKNNLDTSNSDGGISQHTQLITSTLQITDNKIKELNTLINKSNTHFASADEINEEVINIQNLRNSIEASLNSICHSNPQLCDCSNTSKINQTATQTNIKQN